MSDNLDISVIADCINEINASRDGTKISLTKLFEIRHKYGDDIFIEAIKLVKRDIDDSNNKLIS